MALMAFVTYRHLEYPVAIDRVLKMILVHDLVEAEVGDIPYFATGTPKAKKVELEQQAISKICGMLDPATGGEIYDLFQEYEALQSPEAKFAKALDNLEVQIQHNLANLKTWEEVEYGLVYTKMDRFCAHDRYLRELCAAVKQEAEAKMRSGGIDVEAVKGKVGV
jgi:putative hydrolase of HD superfamily